MRLAKTMALVLLALAAACSAFSAAEDPAAVDGGTDAPGGGTDAAGGGADANASGDDPDATSSADVAAIPDGGHVVFLTSTVTRGAFGGGTGADAICQNLAKQTPYANRVFVAYVRATQGGRAGLAKSVGPWFGTDGVKVVDSLPSSNTGLVIPIERNELGRIGGPAGGGAVWTGEVVDPTEPNCQEWSSASDQVTGVVGDRGSTTNWQRGVKPSRACSEQHRLYCFEQ